MPHNIPHILATADALEQGVPNLRFNMKEVEEKTSCGSISCIIGHALAVRDGKFVAQEPEVYNEAWRERLDSLTRAAGDFLGLSLFERQRLFFPDGWTGDCGLTPFNDWDGEDPKWGLGAVTPQGAAKVLRGLAATGRIDWDLALPPSAEPTP